MLRSRACARVSGSAALWSINAKVALELFGMGLRLCVGLEAEGTAGRRDERRRTSRRPSASRSWPRPAPARRPTMMPRTYTGRPTRRAETCALSTVVTTSSSRGQRAAGRSTRSRRIEDPGLTLDASHVYRFARTGECIPRRADRRSSRAEGGGAAESIANRLPAPLGEHASRRVDGTHLYWSGDDGIRAVAKTGGTPALVASAGPNPNATRSTVLFSRTRPPCTKRLCTARLAQPKAGGER